MSYNQSTSSYKILVIDDHPIFRDGLKLLINNETNLKVCGEAPDCHSALPMISATKPDIITLDLSLTDGSGLGLIKQIRAKDKQVKILVASMHDEKLYAERCIRTGANGYINKEEAASSIIEAIREVLDGEYYLSRKMTKFITQRKLQNSNEAEGSPEQILSNREIEVFIMIGKGLSTQKIAKELHLSSKTIDTHKEHIKKKLGIQDSAMLVQQAVAWVMSEASL